MKKENLIKILKDNGVPFNSALSDEAVLGYANDENAVYAQRLYADLYLMAQYGVQNGFGKVRDEIKKISDFIAKLLNGTKYKIVNLTKMEAQRQKIMSGLGDLNGGMNMDMKNQLIKNLDDCIAVSDAIVSFRGDNEGLCSRIAESKKILLQIKGELENVVDVLSKQAANYQVTVFDILMDWRKDVSQYNCFSDNIQRLQTALSQVKEWSKLTSPVGRLGKAKAEKDYYVYSPKYDDVCGIIKAAPFAERTEGLRTAVTEYRESTAYLYNAERMKSELEGLESTLNSERDRLKARLTELSNEYEAIKVEYQNGDLDATTADRRCTACEDEYARYEDELKEIELDYTDRIADLRSEIHDADTNARIREDLAREYERIINMLEGYRNTDPAKFVLLCSHIDFGAMHDTLSGRATATSRNELFTNIQAIISVVEQEITDQRRVASELSEIRKQAKQERQEQVIMDREREIRRKSQQNTTVSHVGRINSAQANEETSVKNMDARMKSGKLGGIKPPAGQNTNVNTDGTIPVDNDDK
ncbi:MAG: hypothetical protein ACI4MQ_01340 [Candidatus Coproplasma sp.]